MATSAGKGAGPTVSVVMPCHAQAEFLPFAIASVALQTYTDWEIVVVDDGSPDDTPAVVHDLACKLPDRRIRLVRQENRGLSEARNGGIRSAEGRLILPLDADDALDPTFLQKTVGALEADPGSSIAGTDGLTFGARSGRIDQPRPWTMDWLRQRNAFACCCVFRREVWDAVGGYNPNLTAGYEDWDFWVGACERGFRIAYVKEPLFFYRLKAESMARGALPRHWSLHARIVLNHPGSFTPAERKGAAALLSAAPLPPARPAVLPELGKRRDWAHLPAPAKVAAGPGDRRNLVICRVGDRSVHRTWLGDPATRGYDVWLEYAGADPGALAGDPARISTGPAGPRWPRLAALVAERAGALARYDAVWIPGDDVVLAPAGVERLFAAFRARGLDLARPALAEGSARCTSFLRSDGAVEVRFVGDEEAAPLFSAKVLRSRAAALAGPEPVAGWAEGMTVLDEVVAFRTHAAHAFAMGQPGRVVLHPQAPAPGMPAVTVVVRCSGRHEVLEEAVRSVAAQTSQDWELLIVDEGWSDEVARTTDRLAADLAGRELRLLRQPRAGSAAAYRAALEQARGRYLLLLEAEDALEPGFLAGTVALLEGEASAVIAAADARVGPHGADLPVRLPTSIGEAFADRFLPRTSLFRRELWAWADGFSELMTRGYEEWDLWLTAVRRGLVQRRVPRPLLRLRREPRASRWDRQLRAQLTLNHASAFKPLAVESAITLLRLNPLPGGDVEDERASAPADLLDERTAELRTLSISMRSLPADLARCRISGPGALVGDEALARPFRVSWPGPFQHLRSLEGADRIPEGSLEWAFLDLSGASEITLAELDRWLRRMCEGGLLAGRGGVEVVRTYAGRLGLRVHERREEQPPCWSLLRPRSAGPSGQPAAVSPAASSTG